MGLAKDVTRFDDKLDDKKGATRYRYVKQAVSVSLRNRLFSKPAVSVIILYKSERGNRERRQDVILMLVTLDQMKRARCPIVKARGIRHHTCEGWSPRG